jgi:CobQ-like glutamine amidotransferase family enzyme
MTRHPEAAQLHLVELYSHHLAVNGDMGNTLVLVERARRAGIEITVSRYDPGDGLPDRVDLVTMGSGPVSAIQAISSDIEKIAPTVRAWAADGAPMLFVGAAFQLAGDLVTGLARPLPGLGVFHQTTDVKSARIVTPAFLVDSEFGRLVGIENHGSTTVLDPGQAPFGRAMTGRGNGPGHDEGARSGESIGTHLHGPVLAMNPVLADHMLSVAARRRGVAYELTAGHRRLDALAEATRSLLEREAESVRGTAS